MRDTESFVGPLNRGYRDHGTGDSFIGQIDFRELMLLHVSRNVSNFMWEENYMSSAASKPIDYFLLIS